MQKSLNSFSVFLTALILMLLIIIFNDFSTLFYYYYRGGTDGLREVIETIGALVVAIAFISGSAALSFKKFKLVKITYIIIGFIIQFVLILVIAKLGLFHVTTLLDTMTLDMVETPMSFFLKCQRNVFMATIAVIIILKWLFDKDFKKLFIIDKEKADFVYYAIFFFLFIIVNACFSFAIQMLTNTAFNQIRYMRIQDFSIIILIDTLSDMSVIFIGLAVIFILNYKNQLSYKNFIYLAALVNLVMTIWQVFPFSGYYQNAVISALDILSTIIHMAAVTFIYTSIQLFCLWIVINILDKFNPKTGQLN
ncbi:hypothetical protein N5853_01050 [Bartonella sp. HY329]|uniref:hypothetical protein n=1 Tax=unclassified Bartonella TaxID=2645622 RepID=UPI0021C9E392|nr:MULTISPECIES: hypothetical protein [unclassified Bartonella]UXM95275.1 hypothetical protein N5853_01050 [Bartonella sp. HY329]UXN09599.1 hypothetical protein N5852_01055 [Bartonella sp. HY328]